MNDTTETRARDPEDWGREEWRQPPTKDGESVIFSEPGRILRGSETGGGVDCRSHSFKVVKPEFGRYLLRVRHGGGDEEIELDYSKRSVDALSKLDSDSRYWLLHAFFDVAHKAEKEARETTRREYAQAFAEGRLKKRRRNNKIYVDVLPRDLPENATLG